MHINKNKFHRSKLAKTRCKQKKLRIKIHSFKEEDNNSKMNEIMKFKILIIRVITIRENNIIFKPIY